MASGAPSETPSQEKKSDLGRFRAASAASGARPGRPRGRRPPRGSVRPASGGPDAPSFARNGVGGAEERRFTEILANDDDAAGAARRSLGRARTFRNLPGGLRGLLRRWFEGEENRFLNHIPKNRRRAVVAERAPSGVLRGPLARAAAGGATHAPRPRAPHGRPRLLRGPRATTFAESSRGNAFEACAATPNSLGRLSRRHFASVGRRRSLRTRATGNARAGGPLRAREAAPNRDSATWRVIRVGAPPRENRWS